MQTEVLVVEDERVVALDLRDSLEDMGYQVVDILARGEDAAAAAERLRPDLVLMDIHLAGQMTGTEAASQIRERLDIPVIFLTAYSDSATLERASGSLPHGYLVKPFDKRELDATLRMALTRHRAEVDVQRSERRLRLALEAARMGVWEWETATGEFESSEEVFDIIGRPRDHPGNGLQVLLERFKPKDRERVSANLMHGEAVSLTLELFGNGPRWVELSAKAFPRGGDRIGRVVGVMRDVTESQQTQAKLRQASAVFETTSEGIAITDAQLRIVSVNPAFCGITGYCTDEALLRSPDEILHARRHGDQLDPRLDESADGHWSGEIACRRKGGEIFPAWEHLCAIRDEDGSITHYLITFSDISELRRAEAHLAHLAYHDHLTGLGNRNQLDETLMLEIDRAQRAGARLAVFFIDLDGFKLVNDTLGHADGDELLRRIALRIRETIRGADNAVRLGGDEFVVVLPDVSRVEDCVVFAEKLLRRIEQAVVLSGEQVSVSGSIGIAVYPDNALTHDALLRAADSAMYAAKGTGRNRYAFYCDDMAARARERLTIEQGLARALDDNQLLLHYQPVVDLASGCVVGVEALCRWTHPDLGEIAPQRFIGIAEDSSLIERLDMWAMRTACRQGMQWNRSGRLPLRIAVNVSVRQMAGDDFVGRVAAVLEETGLPAHQLEIEITETSLQSIDHARETLRELKALGVQIAIDDFGTGFSSLSKLKLLSIDRVKIDQSFVRGLPDDANDVEVTRAIAALCSALKLEMTAEGIETEAQLAMLRSLNCHDGQGYLFSKAMPAAAIDALFDAAPDGIAPRNPRNDGEPG